MASPNRLIATPRRDDIEAPSLQPATPLLRVDALSVSYGRQQVVSDVSFALSRGQSLALIGESGSGKSTIARAVLRLLPNGGHATGRITFDGRDVLELSERRFRPLRGRAIGFVPQDPGNALNPVRSIGAQAMEAAALLDEPDDRVRKQRILETFAQVGLDHPQRVCDSYPHQLSGGQKARVGIARAIACKPRLLVLDEPTAALDVSVQAVVLQLLNKLRREDNLAFLFVSHDLNVVRMMCDRTIVLRTGVIVEQGESRALFANPQTDYTRELVDAVPHIAPAPA